MFAIGGVLILAVGVLLLLGLVVFMIALATKGTVPPHSEQEEIRKPKDSNGL